MAHMRMSHGPHVKESYQSARTAHFHLYNIESVPVKKSRHTCEWVMAHVWRSHGTRVNETRHTWLIYRAHVNESWHTCEWVVAHTWMRHAHKTTKKKIFSTPTKERHSLHPQKIGFLHPQKRHTHKKDTPTKKTHPQKRLSPHPQTHKRRTLPTPTKERHGLHSLHPHMRDIPDTPRNSQHTQQDYFVENVSTLLCRECLIVCRECLIVCENVSK